MKSQSYESCAQMDLLFEIYELITKGDSICELSVCNSTSC
jgi:hypothetical protein